MPFSIDNPNEPVSRRTKRAIMWGVILIIGLTAGCFLTAFETVKASDTLSFPLKVLFVTGATLITPAVVALLALLLVARDWVAYKLCGNREPPAAVTSGLRLFTYGLAAAPLVALLALPVFWNSQKQKKALEEEETLLNLPPLEVNASQPGGLAANPGASAKPYFRPDPRWSPKAAYEAFIAHFGEAEVVRIVVPLPAGESSISAEMFIQRLLEQELRGTNASIYVKAEGVTAAAVVAPAKNLAVLANKLGSKASIQADRRLITADYEEVKSILNVH